MAMNRFKISLVHLLLAVALASPLSAHSIKEVEDKLLKREAYVEIVN